MATGFDVDDFLANLTHESLISCRRSELLDIAARLQVSHPKQILKRDLQELVLEELEYRGLVTRPANEGGVWTVEEGGRLQPEESTPARGTENAPKTPVTLPKFEPLSLGSSDSLREVRLKIRLTRLKMESEERARAREAQLQLDIKRLEIEADKVVRLRELELASHRETHAGHDSSAPSSAPLPPVPAPAFDVSRHIALVPPFKETEIDSYFATFERLASALQWPAEVWPLLLQCKIHGKVQDAVAALPVEDSLNYECVKAAILRAYELVPEAYRQKFRNYKKSSNQSYVEFAREKGTLFDKWCSSCKALDYKSLRETILIEEFKRCLPNRVVVYLNEQKVSTLPCAAILADEYVLTHKFSDLRPLVLVLKKKAMHNFHLTMLHKRKIGHVFTATNQNMS